jgi:hypothetical protein
MKGVRARSHSSARIRSHLRPESLAAHPDVDRIESHADHPQLVRDRDAGLRQCRYTSRSSADRSHGGPDLDDRAPARCIVYGRVSRDLAYQSPATRPGKQPVPATPSSAARGRVSRSIRTGLRQAQWQSDQAHVRECARCVRIYFVAFANYRNITRSRVVTIREFAFVNRCSSLQLLARRRFDSPRPLSRNPACSYSGPRSSESLLPLVEKSASGEAPIRT